jgi:hypothetical protein
VLNGATFTVYGTYDAVATTVSNSRLVGGEVYGPVTCVLVSRGTDVSSGGTCP